MQIMRTIILSSLTALVASLLLSSCGDSAAEQQAILQQRLDSLQQEVQDLRQENARLREAQGQPLKYGFEVQIGAFAEFDLNAYHDELHRFTKVQSQGLNKYVLGRFARKEDAQRFLSDVRRMGLTDAWMAGIADGQRTTVSEAEAANEEYYGDIWLPAEE